MLIYIYYYIIYINAPIYIRPVITSIIGVPIFIIDERVLSFISFNP